MNWKDIARPFAKWCLKYGLNYGITRAAKKVAESPEKGSQVVEVGSSICNLISTEFEAIKDGDYSEEEKAASDKQVDALIDKFFEI